MSDRVGIAVVGLGYWGPNLVRNFSASPYFELRAVVDRDSERCRRIQRAYPAVRTSDVIDSVLEDDSIQAVAIATPVETHYALAKSALEAGKHVFIEKPLTETAEQGEHLRGLAKQCGLTLMVDHTFLFTGSVELLRKLIERDDFGSILYLDSVRVNLGLFQSNVNVVHDLAPHDVSIFNYLLSERPSTVAVQASCSIHSDMEDVAFMTLRYPSGILAHAHLSWLSPVKQRLLTVAGRSKIGLWNDIEPSEKVRIYDKGVEVNPDAESSARRMVSYRTGDMHAPALDSREALSKAIEEFYFAVTEQRPMRSGAEQGLAVVRVLEAAAASIAAGGASVPVSYGETQ